MTEFITSPPTPMSRVYVQIDERYRIIRCEGEYTLPADLTGWIKVDEGYPSDILNLAQTHYLDGGLFTYDGIPRWILVDEQPILRSEAEIESDRVRLSPATPIPTMAYLAAENSILRAQLEDQAERLSVYEARIDQLAAALNM